MNLPLFTDDQFARMADEVRQVLREIGYYVAHPKLKQMALESGCTESASGRVLFHDAQIDELAARLRAQYPKAAPVDPRSRLHTKLSAFTGWGNITPKVFNYAKQMPEGGNAHNLAQLVRFAHSAPYITGLTLPLSRQDLPPQVEQIESLVLMAQLTDKPLGALDVTVPEAVPFVARMGEALGRDPAQFVGCCNCINPPLRLEERTAETMLRRAPLHAMSMITPMPCIGGSSPMDTYGTIIQGTAEIVGGLILSTIADADCPLMGYIASVQVDMRTGNITSSSPQTVQVDAGVYQLMEKHFGGGTRVGGRTYVSARKPGFAAVFEKLLKTVGYSQLVDENAVNYAGGGTLDNGSMTSPEQLLLDLEVTEGMAALTQQPVIPAEGEIMQRLREGIIDLGGNFLIHDHTLTTYRQEMWDPQYFQRATRGRTEKEMLDQAHEEVTRRIEEYQSASHRAEVVRELERIAAEAREELL
jgi:trimethylamine:corrinoid methyltransferase-like protein